MSYDLIECVKFVNQYRENEGFNCNHLKLPKDALRGLKGLEKSFNRHGETKDSSIATARTERVLGEDLCFSRN